MSKERERIGSLMWYIYVFGINFLVCIIGFLLILTDEEKPVGIGLPMFFLTFPIPFLALILAFTPPANTNNQVWVENNQIVYNENDGSISGKVIARLPIDKKVATPDLKDSICDSPSIYLEEVGADPGSAGSCREDEQVMAARKDGKPVLIIRDDESTSVAALSKEKISPLEKNILAYCPGSCSEQELATQTGYELKIEKTNKTTMTLRTDKGPVSVAIVYRPLYTVMVKKEYEYE